MKAYVFAEKGMLRLRELPEPVLSADSEADRRAAILKPRYLAPCASDVHTVYAGNGPRRENLVLGHEGLAEIVSVGDLVRDFRPGELVAVSAVMPDLPDGNGHEHAPFSGSKLGRNQDGMWAEYFRVPDADQNLAHIPDGVCPEQALMAVDMLATGFTAAEDAMISPGQTVLIIGLGAVGLSALIAAKHMGAGTVLAIGSPRGTRAAALSAEYGLDLLLSYRDGSVLYDRGEALFGKSTAECLMERCHGWRADAYGPACGAAPPQTAADTGTYLRAHGGRRPAANSTNSPAVERILDLTGNQGADRVLICGGGAEAYAQACDLMRYGSGIAVNVAYIEGSGSIALPVFSLGRGMAGKTFRFSFCRGGRHRLEALLRLLAEREIPDAGKLVTHRLKGSGCIPDALFRMREKKDGLIKIMVELNGSWQE